MSRQRKGEYAVGYGKPPMHSRFRKGSSGNPRGRPSASKNLSTLLNDALNERVVVVENGRRRKISKRQAIIAQLVNQSAKADLRAIKILLDIQQQIEARAAAAGENGDSADKLDQADQSIIERYLGKYAQRQTK
jgi:Family of unknown function (DUF5681)